jgi:hypothetical protein
MAKRKPARRARKASRKSNRKATRSRASARKSARSARASKGRKPAKKAAAKSRKPRAATRSAKTPRRAAKKKTAPRSEARPKPLALNRERRTLRDDESMVSAPSTLGYSQKASGAESGQQMYKNRKREHTEGGPALTGGDVDADWNDAYSSGEETPGGDMPTPDQDVVEEIGRALGVEYDDAEELKGAPKIEERDRHRWEYDPASAEDYKDRNRRDED